MELAQLWALMRRGWLTLTLVLAASLGVATSVSLLQPVLYAASSTGYVVAGNSATVGDAFAGSTLAAEKAETYIPLVGSRSVAERIAEDLGIPVESVTGRLEGTTDGVIFRITAEAPTPTEAVALADAAIRATSVEANLLETLTVTGESSGQTVVRIVPVEPALSPTQPVSPNWRINLALGGLLGLLLGTGIIVGRHTLDRRIRRVHDAEEIAQTSSLGIVPATPELDGKTALLVGGTAAAEALRQIRTNLQYVSVDNPARSIVVTSSNEGEGKSTIAANLAAMLADAGQPTILVEADLRRPVQAARLGVDGTVGLSQLLAGNVRLSEATQRTQREGLSVITAGRIPPNPAELVGSSRMKSLIEHLSKAHMVIIDAPPLLPVADAVLLTAAADGALLVVNAGKTRAEHLDVAASKVRQVEGALLGLVLNRVAKKDLGVAVFGYGYGSYSSKYYQAAEPVRQPRREPSPRRKLPVEPADARAVYDDSSTVA